MLGEGHLEKKQLQNKNKTDAIKGPTWPRVQERDPRRGMGEKFVILNLKLVGKKSKRQNGRVRTYVRAIRTGHQKNADRETIVHCAFLVFNLFSYP